MVEHLPGDLRGVRDRAILTLNLTSRYYAATRDFAVIDADADDAAAVEETFDSDFAGHAIAAPTGDDLMWSPGSESQTVAFIASARSSVAVENEEMSDPAVIAALNADARRHVKVTVTVTLSEQWIPAFASLRAAGVQVAVDTGETPLYIHAKAVDDDAGTSEAKTVIGSQDDTAASLAHSRELAVILTVPAVVASVTDTLDHDFADAQPWAP